MPIPKEIRAKWLVGMAEYLSDNPQFIVNGFLRSDITGTFDGDGDDEIRFVDELTTQTMRLMKASVTCLMVTPLTKTADF